MPDIELLHKEYQSRRRVARYAAAASLLLFLFSILSMWGIFAARPETGVAAERRDGRRITSTFLSAISIPQDTVYTLAGQILEIDLERQRLFLKWKDGRLDSFKVSTGNPNLAKGIETRTGIFLVQNKIEWLYSLQFDSTKVFNWLGFNFGIGFHSLEGTRYYGNLGLRPSSHGCVRLRTEDAKQLFSVVPVGTPVFVHKRSYARIPAFIPDDVAFDSASYSTREMLTIYDQRLRDLYRGRRLMRTYPVIPLMKKHIGHSGVPVGIGELVPDRQHVPSPSYAFIAMPPLQPAPPVRRLPRWRSRPQEVETNSVAPAILP